MKSHLTAILTIGLLACGGAHPGADTTPAGPTGAANAGDGSAAGDSNDAAAGDSSAAAGDDGSTDKPGPKASDAGEFKVNEADASSRPSQGKLQSTDTEAAVRFFVVDKEKGDGIKGIVISLTAPSGKKYYTEETNADGFAELLVPIGQTYDLVYVSLGRRNVAAKVKVANKPRLNLKLTMRYKRIDYPTGGVTGEAAPRFVLKGVQFETGKATLTGDSHARLDTVVEYMMHKPSARLEISGHTDNVGSKKANKKLSQRRADAVRAYLISQGIDGSRIEAVGYGDAKPIAPNDTAVGRQQNRRIEATEL